jgi:hypothetical protein
MPNIRYNIVYLIIDKSIFFYLIFCGQAKINKGQMED